MRIWCWWPQLPFSVAVGGATVALWFVASWRKEGNFSLPRFAPKHSGLRRTCYSRACKLREVPAVAVAQKAGIMHWRLRSSSASSRVVAFPPQSHEHSGGGHSPRPGHETQPSPRVVYLASFPAATLTECTTCSCRRLFPCAAL